MNQPTHDTFRDGDDALTAPLGEAVAFIRSQPGPPYAMRRAVETAAAWGESPPPGFSRVRRIRIAAAALTGLAACVAVGIVIYALPDGAKSTVAGGNPTTAAATAPATSINRFFQPTPLTHPVVAERATVFVTVGPAQPALLGARVAHADILAATADAPLCLHAWNWSSSPTSRVIPIPGGRGRAAPAALSPDGMLALNLNGDATDLATGRRKRYAGFGAADDRRLERLRFSPDGKLVAAMLSTSGKDGRVSGLSVRLIELATGAALAEFPSDDVDWYAWVAFAPDAASVFHADPANVVTRRDARTGTLITRYAPPLEPHGAVGIAVSPDGRYVAAGHYHGELFVWDVASGALVLRHAFLRSNGERDTFWQAKVLAFSPDGESLATSSTGRVQVIETRTGRVVARADAPLPAHVAHLRWSPDGRAITLVLASALADSPDPSRASQDGADVLPRVYHWDWRSGNPPGEWTSAGDAEPAPGG
jgi:DNA-binding beta-propeller fold protein YncE